MTVQVQLVGPVTIKPTVRTEFVVVPGIAPSAAYASGDAMGTQFAIAVPPAGRIEGVLVADMDKEQLEFDVVLFTAPIDQTADNAAFDLTDADRTKYVGYLKVTAADYIAFNDNAVAEVKAVGKQYVAPSGMLVCQCVTRGVPNYTAATDLSIALLILPD